jgi:alanyl-tRNA synthetase
VEELPRRVVSMQEELKQLKQELARLSKASVAETAREILSGAETVGEVKIVCQQIDNADRDTLREYADQLRQQGGSVALLLGAEIDGKVALLAAVSKDLIKRGLKAGDCVREAAKTGLRRRRRPPRPGRSRRQRPEQDPGRTDNRAGLLHPATRRLNLPE